MLQGVFTAPRTGLYSLSASIVFDPLAIRGQFELSSFGSTEGLKSVVPYLSLNTLPLTNTIRALFYLQAGGTMSVSVYISGAQSAPKLSTDENLNTLTIVEM